MDITIRNISSGSAQELSAPHLGERRARPGAARGTMADQGHRARALEDGELRASGLEEYRSRLLLLQREVARAQRVLGGLEGLEARLGSAGTGQPSEESLQAYAAAVTYRGEPVLASLGEQLERILRDRDGQGLRGLIEESTVRLGRLAMELSRFETAQQNSRAIAGGGDPLESLKEGIREAGGRLLEIQRENVLRLLG